MNKFADIALQRITYLRGPNIWTYRSVLEVWLDLGPLEDFPSHTIEGLNDRLTQWLPALEEHACGVGERGGFLQRLREGTWMGHVLEHVVIELLNLGGMPTGFGQTRSTSQRGVYRMVFRARDEQVARCALAQGHALLMAAINNGPFDTAQAVRLVREQLDASYLGPSTAAIVQGAADRGIPHIRLNDGNLVQLGYGAKQKRIWTAETELTSAIAEGIAREKDLTKSILKSCGVPVPEGQVVDSAQAAWEAAQDIGTPVVVKPSDANHGRGVSLELSTEAEVLSAFAIADTEGSEVMVERFVPGFEHRVLVVGYKVVAAARGEVLHVTGDGQHSVRELIDRQLNSDPRRGEAEEFPLETLVLEREPAIRLLLERQGFTPDSVPQSGLQVLVQRNGNMCIDCTDDVHPEVAHACTLAAKAVGLDIAGIDLVTPDISRPLEQVGGAVVEVNAGPGLLMHLKPVVGSPRPVGRAIVDHLFPEGESGRIPVVGITGTQHGALVAALVAWLAHLGGHNTGLACDHGVFFNRRQVEKVDGTTYDAAHRLLINRALQAAVVQHPPLAISRDGLPYDRCLVGVVTDFGGIQALAEHDVHSVEQLRRVLRTQIDVVLPEGAAVLHAADDAVAELADLCDGDVVFFAADGHHPRLLAHLAEGRRAAMVRQGRVFLAEGNAEHLLGALDKFLPRLSLAAPSAADNMLVLTLLAAAAAAWATGLSPTLIAAGLETFEPLQGSPRVVPAAQKNSESGAPGSVNA